MTVYALFADILDYPGPAVAAQVRRCLSELAVEDLKASELMARFQTEQARKTLGELQELYTSTFELRPDCTPNLGYHLFGNDARRNMFMAQLKTRMETYHVAMGSELPDHLSLVLRLLERQDSEEERSALLEDCLVPALSRMLEVLNQDGEPNAYGNVLRALLHLLRRRSRVEAIPAEAVENHPTRVIAAKAGIQLLPD